MSPISRSVLLGVSNLLRRCLRHGLLRAEIEAMLLDIEAALIVAPASSDRSTDPFQERVHGFVLACFSAAIAADKVERNHRFLEEALELVQAIGCTASEAHQLVDYVYGRPAGETHLEAGGVMVTLAALCTANGLNMVRAGEDELARVWGKIDVIREKQRKKPKHSPLPEVAPNSANRSTVDTAELLRDRSDAERFRWLKANHLQTGTDSWIRTGDDLEEAIDAALRAEGR